MTADTGSPTATAATGLGGIAEGGGGAAEIGAYAGAGAERETPSPTIVRRETSTSTASGLHGTPSISISCEPEPSLPATSPSDAGHSPVFPSPLSRPVTANSCISSASSLNVSAPNLLGVEKSNKQKRRRSWFGRKIVEKEEPRGPQAWVLGQGSEKPEYDSSDILNGAQDTEIWNHQGDCLIYLFPRGSGNGPQFRISSSLLAASKPLLSLAGLDEDKHSSLESPLSTSSENVCHSEMRDSLDVFHEVHLYLPVEEQPESAEVAMSLDTVVRYRNFFAFLSGQPLVATEQQPSLLIVFMGVSALLSRFEFTNFDGSTFGEVATTRFDSYMEKFELLDIRTSREKTIEGIVLGERMKSVKLYNEAFTHAVGKYDELVALKSPAFEMISHLSSNRLGRMSMELERRVESVRRILEDFDFPSIFSGILSSRSADERLSVDFSVWRTSFFETRKFVMHFLRSRWGAWPPKASSKKNNLVTGGLNRVVLVELYSDLCSMYDLLVDRTNLTSRTADGVPKDDEESTDPRVSALRQALSEYDRSSPPVKPPIPFDLPIMPTLETTRPGTSAGKAPGAAKVLTKKLKEDEIARILEASHNEDAPTTPFVEAFKTMERKRARHSNIQHITELRLGQWTFMYAVLQALPLVVIDAPELKHTEAVEYFLCEPPKFGVPWAREGALRDTSPATVLAGGGVVSLPADLLPPGSEGIYRRSHCWIMAEVWSVRNNIPFQSAFNPPIELEPLEPPRPIGVSRPSSRSSNRSYMSSYAESQRSSSVTLPSTLLGGNLSPVAMSSRPRPVSVYDPSKTFDTILGSSGQSGGKKK